MTLTVTIKVVPGSSQARIHRQQWTLDNADIIKCYRASPPKNGKANSELIRLLADICKLAPSKITIIKGATQRIKTVHIPMNITRKKLLKLLLLEHKLDDTPHQLSIPE